VDRLLGRGTVHNLLVFDVAVFVALLMVATVIVVRSGRRSRRQPSMPREAAVQLADEGMTQPEVTLVPGLNADATPSDPAAYGPVEQAARSQVSEAAEPEQAAQSQVSEVASSEAGPDGPAMEPDEPPTEPDMPAIEPDGPATKADGPAMEPDGPATEPDMPAIEPDGSATKADGPAMGPDGQQSVNGAVTGSGPIGNYYEGADQPVANYLAERGWDEEPETGDPDDHPVSTDDQQGARSR
jgi:hypothetical protein